MSPQAMALLSIDGGVASLALWFRDLQAQKVWKACACVAASVACSSVEEGSSSSEAGEGSGCAE